MTAPVSLLPVSASVDMATGTSLPVTDNATNGETNPFTQLLQGIVAIQTGEGQQQELPFMVELSVNGELDSEGSLLPDQGQAIAISELVNPFMSFSAVEGQQQASLHLPLPDGISVLDNKSTASLQDYLAALTARQTTNPALAAREGITAQVLPGTDMDSVVFPEMATQQKADQAVIGLSSKMTSMLEQQAAAKADNSAVSTLTNNHSLSATGLTSSVSTSVRADVASTPPAITVPPQNPAWTQQVGERMQWMINQKMQKVEIRLDPPELGSMEVRIVVQKDQAHVSFAAPNAHVRDALEAALPRLREMMTEQGLNLADVDVGQHSLGQQNRENATDDVTEENSNDSAAIAAVEQPEQEDSVVLSTSNGMLDAYA